MALTFDLSTSNGVADCTCGKRTYQFRSRSRDKYGIKEGHTDSQTDRRTDMRRYTQGPMIIIILHEAGRKKLMLCQCSFVGLQFLHFCSPCMCKG